MEIDIDWDSSVDSAPAGFKTAVMTAVQYLDNLFTNPVTITIAVGYGEVAGQALPSGDLSASEAASDVVESYSAVRNALIAEGAPGASTLPAASPDQGTLLIPIAEAVGLGLSPSNGSVDGYIGISSSYTFSYANGTAPPAGEYYLIGAVEHEITEDMGRVSFVDYQPNDYSAMDLFRYSSPGVRDLADGGSGSTAYFSIDNGTTNLGSWNNNPGNGDLGDWYPSGPAPGGDDAFNDYASPGVVNVMSPSDITLMEALGWTAAVACYCRGTRIMTAEGEVAVEDLAIGDRVLTESGWLRPVKWIGRRGYGGRFVAGNRDVLPVVIRAGALAEGVPSRDLWVSPEHAMLLDGVLVPARLLLNGATITQADAVERVEYFHIELAAHDVILAEGAAAESFVDCDSRGMFHNAGEYAALYPGDAGPGWRFCAPRVEAASAALAAIRARLGARAGVGAAARDGMAGNIELFDGRRIEGWAFDPAHPQARVRLEVLCDGELVGHVVAERYRADLEAAGKGDGRCSFAFALPVGLDPLSRHRVELRRASDGAAVPGSPVSVPAAAPFDAAARQAASGLLARVMPEEIDGTVGYLVGQTERLLAARARLDGGSRGAVADLRSRWGGLVPSRALREAAPALQPRALFVDERFPAERAGADAALAPMRALQGLGFVVSFVAARDPAGGAGGAEFLAARGIKALTAPWYGSVEEALRSHAGGLDLVYLHQASNAAAYGELVRHYCPQAQLVYGVSARHRPGRTCDQLAAAATADAVIVPSRAEAALLRAALAGVAVRIVPWPAPSAPNLAAAGEARIDAAMRDIVRPVLRRWETATSTGVVPGIAAASPPARERARAS